MDTSSPFVQVTVSFVGLSAAVLVHSAFYGHWKNGLAQICGLAIVLSGWMALARSSLDARLATTSKGIITKARVTQSRLQPYSHGCFLCCSGSTRQQQQQQQEEEEARTLIQYSYTLPNGQTYTNTKAWFDYHHDITLQPDTTTIAENDNGTMLEVVYLADCPVKSLPKTRYPDCTADMRHGIAPSAGSLNYPTWNLNHGVFLILVLIFIMAATLWNNIGDDSLLLALVDYTVHVILACLVYYFGWLKPRERKQQFSTSSTIPQ